MYYCCVTTSCHVCIQHINGGWAFHISFSAPFKNAGKSYFISEFDTAHKEVKRLKELGYGIPIETINRFNKELAQ